MVNDDLQEGLHLEEPSQTAAASAPVPMMRPCHPTPPPGDSPTLAGSFGSVFCGVCAFPFCLGVCKILFVHVNTEVSVSPSPVEVL